MKLTKFLKSTSLVLILTGLFGSVSAYDNYDPCCMDPCSDMPDFQVYLDFLYWQRAVEGEAYAATGVPDTSGDSAGKFFNGGCDLTPGFRIGGVVNFGCCEWDFFAQYAWLNPEYSETAEGNGRTLIGIFRPNAEIPLDSASLHHDDHYNVLDFGMGRSFNVSNCFVFRPHLGFKATWQELNKKTEYNFREDADNGVTIRYLNNIDFNGIGPRAGFDTAWKFNDCFSVVGGLALSAVYSDLDVSTKREAIVLTDGTASDPITILDSDGTNCTLIPAAEWLVGIRWDSRICDCYDIFVFIGWEAQVWFNLNQFANDSIGAPLVPEVLPTTPVPINPAANPVSGNVTMHGLTARVGFGF